MGISKKSEKPKNWAKFQKCQKWYSELPPSIWGHYEWNAGQMSDLLTVVCSEFLCKTHIFNFKTAVSQPIRSFQYFGNLQKKSEKHKNSAKIRKCQKWSPELSASLWIHCEWNTGQVIELLALLDSESLCKTHIFHLKSAVFQPISGSQYLGTLQKN